LHLLCNPRLFDRLAGGDLGFVDGLIAGDLEIAHPLFLRNAGAVGGLAGNDGGLLDDSLPVDFQRTGFLFGGDALGLQGFFTGNAGGFDGLLRGDLGLFEHLLPLDLQ
jgi:hypothetical protein